MITKLMQAKTISVYSATKELETVDATGKPETKVNRVCKVTGVDNDGALVVAQTSLNGKNLARVMKFLGSKGLTGEQLAAGEFHAEVLIEHDGDPTHSWSLSIDGSDEALVEEAAAFLA
jgi:hypothetical protein